MYLEPQGWMLQTLSSRGFRPPHSPAGASLRKALNAELCQRNSSGRGSDTLKKDRGQVISGDIPPCPHNTLDPPFLPTFSTRMTAYTPPNAVSSFLIVSVCFIILIVSVCFIFCQCVFCLHLPVSQAPVHSELDEHGLVEANV